MILRLAWRNLIGGGFRTWLNVFILSVVMVTIVGFQGMYNGWQNAGELGRIRWHIADGQFWQEKYDPYDPFSFDESRDALPDGIDDENTVEFLVSQGVVYPQGRRKTVIINGVETEQNILDLPTEKLSYEEGRNKMMLGYRMAEKLKVDEGDKLILRWRDKNGRFAAGEFEVVHIFTSSVLTIDQGQIWLSLKQLREMLGEPDKTTYISYAGEKPEPGSNWLEQTQSKLLSEFRDLIAAKRAGGAFLYMLLLFLAMIAVFDTQVLALFKRRREIGMMMALGVNRSQVMKIFTFEGLLSGFLAIGLGTIWGTPLLIRFAEKGLPVSDMASGFGMDGIADALYPQFSIALVANTLITIMIILLLVSYLPVRSISKLNAVEALR